VLALISLGYKQVDAHKAIRVVMKAGDGTPTAEELVRQALKVLS
jgi:Holliday junction DNA helicase RuvA